MPEVLPVYIRRSFLHSVLPHVLEIYNREVDGLMIGEAHCKMGSRRKKNLSLRGSHTYLTSENAYGQTRHKNIRALKRVISTLDVLGEPIVGSYHSHPNGIPALSNGDRIAIEYDAKLIGYRLDSEYDRWLEIIFTVDRQPREVEEPDICPIENGYLMQIPHRKSQYDVTVCGFWVNLRNTGQIPQIAELYMEGL